MGTADNCEELMVHISGVKKIYKLGQIGGGTLQGDLQSWWARIRGREDPNLRIDQSQRLVGQTFMALNGIDLDIYKGERLGIIGSNGAGKSTLLKLLSRVTAPTAGRIDLYGRVASMLEVGTGFNGEMTGRENVYLNGAILGMTKQEIDRKLPEIIEFSEVGDFIDTPVKRYSSGMYVKLAFSVAAHLDSEIMIMDEVLAVGDMAFQKKCLDKMRGLALEENRTVLYVSHNMNTIRTLCNRCIVLNQGKVIFEGDVDEAINIYSKSKDVDFKTEFDLSEVERKDNLGKISLINRLTIENTNLKMGESLHFTLSIHSNAFVERALLRFVLFDQNDEGVGMAPSVEFTLQEGDNEISFAFSTDDLIPGIYTADVILCSHDQYSYLKLDATGIILAFEVEETQFYFGAKWERRHWGKVRLNKIRQI